ncbi:adenosylcobinamide-GDP ribazoletransferase [Streptomyces sp. NPDC057877]|uniref:adenosylcobinamide-GDP ribazoletransferase n=1 Tax=Streptomyces sp. NPDC057877 TaxID=3346269 RepID=UPI0036B4BAEB
MFTSPASHGLRFAFGTLTVLPVRVTRWDREAARGGMLTAPVVGLTVGCGAALVAVLLLVLGASPALAAVGAVATPAVLTRGLHLDGLADTADGLGSGKPAEDALRIMKQSDIGPFGVLALVFVVAGQIAALAQVYDVSRARGAFVTVTAAVVARTALTLATRAGVPAARPDGLGAAVAGVVPVRWAAGVALVVVGAAAAVAGVSFGAYEILPAVLAVLAALAVAELLLRHCTRRFGGVTGDVFGGVAESTATAALVAMSLSLG